MAADRLTSLDASFLDVETASAHMHVGWAASFAPPPSAPAPSFEQLHDHIVRRLTRAPRYRQRIANVPLGVNRPVWVDDEEFDIDRHLRRAPNGDLAELADTVLSTPLARDRPLWELWIADRLEGGGLGLVGKAHHCMVDGIAAVELAGLLLDPEPESPPDDPERWTPSPTPGAARRLVDGVVDRIGDQLRLVTAPARIAGSPRRAAAFARRAGQALVSSLTPTAPAGVLNDRLSPYRRLATLRRTLDELKLVKRAFGTTVNDVVLAVSAGALAGYLDERGQEPRRLKTMVPVNVRDNGGATRLGNRISFLFMELPCDEPDPARRLLEIHAATRERKERGEPEGSDAVLDLVSYAPSAFQRALSRVVASPRTSNLVVSNIPGPQQPLYMLGCELVDAYPVVPLADRHTLSIGFTTVAGRACFGLYADRDALPDADVLAAHVDVAVEELLELSREREPVGA
jgi:diacylglycerol O-acyltransferase / wax synthase